MNTLQIKKFVSQKCLGYRNNAMESQWHLVAEFNDGKTREIREWFRESEWDKFGYGGYMNWSQHPYTSWTIV